VSVANGAALALVANLAFACETNEACTKARLAASNTWEEVTENAASTKLRGGIGYEDLSEEKKAEHYKAWEEIEKKADMVFKSFAFERITWNTATPARASAEKAFQAYFARDDYKGFQTLLAAANEEFEKTEKACQ
jgi:hypothetical protein